MPRKKKTKPGLKKAIGIALGIILTLAIISQAYGMITGDEDWTIVDDIIRQAKRIKNAFPGCCLPQCEQKKEAICYQLGGNSWTQQSCNTLEECKYGCCQIKCDGCEEECKIKTLPKAVCLHTDGSQWNEGTCKHGCCYFDGETKQLPQFTCETCIQDSSWKPGKCKKGFSVHLEDTASGQALQDEFLDALLKGFTGDVVHSEVKMTVDAYTCEKTPLSTWKGTITTTTTGYNPAVGTKTNTRTNSITMPFSPERTNYGLPDIFSAEINGNQIKVTLNLIVLSDPITLEGTITKGADECKNK